MTDMLFQMGFTATWQAMVLAGVVFIVLSLFRERLQPRWRYLLWCVVLLRLAMPVLPETPWGIWNETVSHAVPMPEVEPMQIIPQPMEIAEVFEQAESPADIFAQEPVVSTAEEPKQIGFPSADLLKTGFLVIWLAGFVFLSLKHLWNEYRFHRQNRRWKPADDVRLLALFDECRKTVGVRRRVRLKTTPDDVGAGCFGFFRPVIVLSESATQMNENDLRMILVHELVHLKRLDPLVLRLSMLLSLIHWPNPLVWFVLSRLQREREPACDAAVLHILGQNKQKDYGLAILAFAELFPCRERLPGLVGIFEKNGTARRIEMIIKYKRSKWPHALLGLLIITLIAALGLTRAGEKPTVTTDQGTDDIAVTEVPIPLAVENRISLDKNVRGILDEDSLAELSGEIATPVRFAYLFDSQNENTLVFKDGIWKYEGSQRTLAAPFILRCSTAGTFFIYIENDEAVMQKLEIAKILGPANLLLLPRSTDAGIADVRADLGENETLVKEGTVWKNETTGKSYDNIASLSCRAIRVRKSTAGIRGKCIRISDCGRLIEFGDAEDRLNKIQVAAKRFAEDSPRLQDGNASFRSLVGMSPEDVFVFHHGRWTHEKDGYILADGATVYGTSGQFRLTVEGDRGKVARLSGQGASGEGKYLRFSNGGNSISETRTRETPTEISGKPEQTTAKRIKAIGIHTVDETGKPLSGVDIRVLLPDFKDDTRAKTSDEHGAMLLGLPDSPKELIVSATAPGRVPQIVHWSRDDMSAGIGIPGTITFTLRKGTTIGGTVVDTENKPVAGASVRMISRPNGYGMPGHLKPADSHILAYGDKNPNTFGGVTARKTDANGRWTLDNVPEGKFYPVEIKITHPDYQMNDQLGSGSFSTQNNALAEKLRKGEYRFTMKPGASVSGTVRDADGKPVKDALIVPGGDPTYYYDDRQQAVRTDAEGKYRLGSLRFGSGTITVIAEGFAPDMKNADFGKDTKAIDFELKPGETISFRFIDENGKPIPKVQLNIGSNPSSWWREGSNFFNKARSGASQDPKIPVYADDDGFYRWDWAPADRIRFSFHKENFLMEFPGDENWFVARPEPYEITLHHRKIFRGTVVDSEIGNPIAGYKLVYGTHINDLPDVENYVWQTPQEQVFPGGVFEYAPNFKYDKYWLRFTADGYEPFIAGPYLLEEAQPTLRIELKRKLPEKLSSGQVLKPDGKPSAGAKILLAKERTYVEVIPPNLASEIRDPRRQLIEADGQGKFHFEKPTDSPDYRLYVADSNGFAQVDKAEFKDGMSIQLQRYGKLEIKIPYDTKPEALNR